MEQFSTQYINQVYSLIRQRGAIVLSNFYGVDENEVYYGVCSEESLAIVKNECDYQRMYVVTINTNDLISLLSLSLITDQKYVINIPTKGDIAQWDNLLKNFEFKQIGTYHRYNNLKIKYRKSAIGEYANINQIGEIEKLLQDNFSKYTDHLPTKKELSEMIQNNQVLVDLENGAVVGCLIYTIEGKKVYLNVWIDKGGNGLFLLYKVYNIIFDLQCKMAYFWVNDENLPVIKLHLLMGASQDGLVDYTYLKE